MLPYAVGNARNGQHDRFAWAYSTYEPINEPCARSSLVYIKERVPTPSVEAEGGKGVIVCFVVWVK